MASSAKNMDDVNLIATSLFLQAVGNGDFNTVKKILESSREQHSGCMNISLLQYFHKKYKLDIAAYDAECPSGSFVTFSDWLEGVNMALDRQSRAIIDLLLRFGKSGCWTNRYGWTILHMAISRYQSYAADKWLKIVEMLLKCGKFEVNSLTNELETVLHFACRCPSDAYKIIPIIVAKKLNINIRNIYGKTALMIACENGNSAAVRELWKWKVENDERLDIAAVDNYGQSALSFAKQSNNSELVALIGQWLFLNAVENADLEAIFTFLSLYEDTMCMPIGKRVDLHITEWEVLYCRSVKCFKFSASKPATIKRHSEFPGGCLRTENTSQNKVSTKNKLPIKIPITLSVWLEAVSIAERRSHSDILKLLLSYHYFFRGLTEDGQTVLHLAVSEFLCGSEKSKQKKKVEILLNSGKCDVNAVNSQGETVLHMACNINCQTGLKFPSLANRSMDYLLNILLENRADLNRKNIRGKTALMLACEHGNSQLVSKLLHFKARHGFSLDLDASDNFGDTAMMIAKRLGNTRIVSIFQQRIFLRAVEIEDKDVVIRLIRESEETWRTPIIPWSKALQCMHTKKEKSEEAIDEITWKEALRLASGQSSTHILEILLDYTPIVQSQGNGDTIITRFFRDLSGESFTRNLNLIEIVSRSGRVNVNTMNFDAETILHLLFYGCDFGSHMTHPILCDGSHHNSIHEAVLILLRNKANINQKDKDGNTPLGRACQIGCTSVVRTILNWAMDTNAWMDLDTKDRSGRTALMKAAMWKRPDIVEMLLNAGASVNLSDNCDFTPLHHTLFEFLRPNIPNWISYGEFPRCLNELKAWKERNTFNYTFECDDAPNTNFRRNRNQLNEDKTKTVRLLLETPNLDLNALNCEGYSPLDIAEAFIPEIPSSIIDALKQRGGTFNIYRLQNQPLGNNPVTVAGSEKFLSIWLEFYDSNKRCDEAIKRENFSKLNEIVRKQMTSAKDQRGRTALHCAIISFRESILFWNMSRLNLKLFPKHESIDLVEMMISYGCKVNDTDINGRSPLHYANGKLLQSLLLSYGADPAITDKDGLTAIEMSEVAQINFRFNSSNKEQYLINSLIRRIDETSFNEKQSDARKQYRHNGHTGQIMEIYPLCTENREIGLQIQSLDAGAKVHWCKHLNPKTIPDDLWKFGEYAFRHPEANETTMEVTEFMKDIASEIEKRDPRFQTRLLLVGSSYEGTHIDLPNEFDFDLVLTKISELCQVYLSPELPSGFVRIKRRPTLRRETQETEFDSFFDEDGILIVAKISEMFEKLLDVVSADSQFIENHNKFDWGFKSEMRMPFQAKATTLLLKKTKFHLGSKYSFAEISVDVIPCIHISGWWPDEAIANVNGKLKSFGCNLVFDYPQRLHPWILYTGSCARISFAPAESEMIKHCSNTAKQAYLIAKQLISKGTLETSYLLKTSFLYCIEAFTLFSKRYSAMELTSEDADCQLNQIDYHVWLEILMKCHLDFVLQDFLPCYFMPTFILPVKKYPKYYQTKWFAEDDFAFPEEFFRSYILYRSISRSSSEMSFSWALLDSIPELFDRKTLITDLLTAFLKDYQNKSDSLADSSTQYCDDWCKLISID